MNKADPFGDMEAASDLTSVDAPSQQQPASPADEPVQAENVGALLCATRMRMAGDLQAIAKILRIRYSYLVAIEDGRYEDLPGSAYSVGFVRAYADYLGLDGNEVVKRLREETNGTVTKTRFEFPLPSGESGLPNGGLLAIAVAMGVIVYGAWYTMTNADRDAVDLIQEMPSRIAVLIEDDSAQSDAERSDAKQIAAPAPLLEDPSPLTEMQTQETAALNQDAQALPEMDTVETNAVNDSNSLPEVTELSVSAEQDRLGGELEVASIADAEDGEREVVSPDDQETGVSIETAVVSTDLPAAGVVSESTVQPDLPQSGANVTGSEVEPEIMEDVAEPSSSLSAETEIPVIADDVIVSPELPIVGDDALPTEVAAEDQETPIDDAKPEQTAVLSEKSEPESPLALEPTESANTSSSDAIQVIELRAKSDSWIQVRDGNELLLTRLLREGEVYQVPDRSGLTLMTGNAGGLEVFVGGELMPALGDVGVVKRGVPLSPERLRTGSTPG